METIRRVKGFMIAPARGRGYISIVGPRFADLPCVPTAGSLNKAEDEPVILSGRVPECFQFGVASEESAVSSMADSTQHNPITSVPNARRNLLAAHSRPTYPENTKSSVHANRALRICARSRSVELVVPLFETIVVGSWK